MAITELIFGAPVKAQIGTQPPLLTGLMQFDCSLSEVHTDEAEVTEHPVETGANITDHIRKLPATVEINGLVTDTPIAILASVTAKSPVQGALIPSQKRSDDAYTLLQQFMENGDLLRIVTSLRDYDNMALTSLSVTRDAANGQVLNCVASLREVFKAKDLSILLPVPQEVQNKGESNQGNKDKEKAKPKQEERATSSLSSLTGIGA
jgi:hypothetical protein